MLGLLNSYISKWYLLEGTLLHKTFNKGQGSFDCSTLYHCLEPWGRELLTKHEADISRGSLQ